jgi:DNA-directed RNA polymerase subunit H (RpoH/RPB5)/riboflavin synthase
MTEHVERRLGKLNNTAQSLTDTNLARTLTTCVQMLRDRGCINLQACQTVGEIKQHMLEARCVVMGLTPEQEAIEVFFHNEERVGVKQLRVWTENRGCDKMIIVSLDGPTAFTRKESETLFQNVQFFTFQELCVNITRHKLVPLHEKISRAEVPVDLSESCAELPILATSDKVAQYYGYKPGDIIRITRTAGVQEPVYYFRIVRNIGG